MIIPVKQHGGNGILPIYSHTTRVECLRTQWIRREQGRLRLSVDITAFFGKPIDAVNHSLSQSVIHKSVTLSPSLPRVNPLVSQSGNRELGSHRKSEVVRCWLGTRVLCACKNWVVLLRTLFLTGLYAVPEDTKHQEKLRTLAGQQREPDAQTSPARGSQSTSHA